MEHVHYLLLLLLELHHKLTTKSPLYTSLFSSSLSYTVICFNMCSHTYSRCTGQIVTILHGNRRVKAGSQYDAVRAMREVKRARVRRNRLGFYSCVSCVHALRRIVNRAIVCTSEVYMICRTAYINKATSELLITCYTKLLNHKFLLALYFGKTQEQQVVT